MNNQTLSLKINLKIVCLLLLTIIATMLFVWKPWDTSANGARKITIVGEAEIEAVPDEFVFYPTFNRTGTDQQKLKEELNTFGQKLQVDLKGLGVKEEDITLDSSSYDLYYYEKPDSEEKTVTLATTVKVSDKELAQKVQDYLAQTDAQGQLTAQSQFSEKKRKDLETEARDKAIEDARTKADRTAKNLQAKLGKVIEVKDDEGYGFAIPYERGIALDSTTREATASLPVTPGKDTITFRVQVIFGLR